MFIILGHQISNYSLIITTRFNFIQQMTARECVPSSQRGINAVIYHINSNLEHSFSLSKKTKGQHTVVSILGYQCMISVHGSFGLYMSTPVIFITC